MNQMQDTIQPGKYVTITYTIFDQGGATLEYNDVPMGYVYGGPQTLIGDMEAAVLGKRAGDVVEMLVPPERGFGEHDPNLVFIDDLDNVPDEFRHVGAEVPMQSEATGDVKNFFVTRIAGGKLTVDGNHPMAGKTLRVKVKILQVRDATPADMQEKIPGAPIYH